MGNPSISQYADKFIYIITPDFIKMKRLYPVSIIILLLLISISSVLGLLDARCNDKNYVFDQSDLVVTGAVSQSRSFLRSDNSIYTLTEIHVDNNLKDVKGNRKEWIVVKTSGGEVGNVGQSVEDQPRFTTAEYTKLYLKRNREFQQKTPITPTYSVVCGENGVDRISSLTSLDITTTIDLSALSGAEQFTNHNINDNVCCIDDEGRCNKNVQSANSNSYKRCFENEDCFKVPQCTFGCCETETNTIRTCSYTTQSACESNRNLIVFYSRGNPSVPANTPEDCEALCRGPPTVTTVGREEPNCNPTGIQEINIREASGGRFDHIDAMYNDGTTYRFFIGNSYFTLSNNPFERKLEGPFSINEFINTLFDSDYFDIKDSIDHIDAILPNYPETLGNVPVFFVDELMYYKPNRKNYARVRTTNDFLFDGIHINLQPPFAPNRGPVKKIDAALYYDGKYYIIIDNDVFIYNKNGVNPRKFWSQDKLNNIIPGCNSIDSAMYYGNNIYFSKGEKAWIVPLDTNSGFTRQRIERQETENLPKVESLNLDFKDGQALCSAKGTADSNTQLLVQFRYSVNGKVVSSFGSPIAAEFFREGLTANYEPINSLINEFNQGNIFKGVNPEINFNGIKIKDGLSIECDAIPYRINDDGTIKIDDAVIRVKSTPLVFRRNAVARFFANIFRRGPGAP